MIGKLDQISDINKYNIDASYKFDEIMYVDISSIIDYQIDSISRYSLSESPSRAKRIVNNNDTILSTVRPNLKAIAFIKQPPENMIVSTGFSVLSPKEKICPRFLYYNIINQAFTDYLAVQAKGSAYPAVDSNIIRNGNIFIYPEYTQKKIAGVLAAFDELIEVNRRKIKILEEMAQAVYNEWFVKMRFPGHEKYAPPIGNGNNTAPYRVFDSPLGPIPEGWEVKHIDDICSVVNSGGTPSTKEIENWDGGINWFTTKELNDNYIFESEKKISSFGLENSSAKIFPTDTIVIAIYGATIGKLGILANVSSFNQAACGFVVKKASYHDYLYIFLYLSRLDLKNLAIGAAQQNISVGLLRKYNIIDPGLEVMNAFSKISNHFFEEIKTLSLIINNLSSLRDLFLPKLISGKIDVSELDIDEYALGDC